MDFVVDVQGLKDKNNKFIPKEVAFVSLQGNVTGHWMILPPHEFDELRSDLKTTNDYVSSRMHGVQWFDGEVTMRKLKNNLYNIARRAVRIYVRGHEKGRFLQSMMSRPIINVEEYDTLNFIDLERRFSCDHLCCFHACDENATRKQYCALRRAHLIKSWLHSILPEELDRKTGKITSEIFYDSLNKQLFRRKTRTKFQDESACGNDVCDCEGDHDNESESGSEVTQCASFYELEEDTLIIDENKQDEHQRDKKSIGKSECEDDRSLCG